MSHIESAKINDRAIKRDWVGTLTVEILKNTSPELAIKIAYDFGRNLRLKGQDGDDLPELLEQWVYTPFRESPLLRYIRAGFIAGHGLRPLPWKRQIDAEEDGGDRNPS